MNNAGQVAESNTQNNSRSCSLAVTPTLPDVVVASLTAQPASGPAGSAFGVDVRVSNLGGVRLPGGRARVRCTIHGAEFNGGSRERGGLDAGQSLARRVNLGSNLTPGSKTVRCTVAPENNVNEMSEINNTSSSLTITVTAG